MIYGYIPKSKQKKLTKAEQQRKEEWLISLNKISNQRYSRSSTKSTPSLPQAIYRRETPYYNSVDTGFIPCTKPDQTVYTGDKIKGIGTMHKSNAVPVFNNNEAKEIASMRR